MTATLITARERQILSSFARGRDVEFIIEALQEEPALVRTTVEMAQADPEIARELVRSFDAAPKGPAAVPVASPAAAGAAAERRPSPRPRPPAPPPAATTVDVCPEAPTHELPVVAPVEEVLAPPAPPAGSPVAPDQLEVLLARAAASSNPRTRAIGVRLGRRAAYLRARLDREHIEQATAPIRRKLARHHTQLAAVRAELKVATATAEAELAAEHGEPLGSVL